MKKLQIVMVMMLAVLPLMAAADEPKPIVKVLGAVERTIPDNLVVNVVVEPATGLARVPQPAVQEVTLAGEVVDPTAVVASLVTEGAQTFLRLTLDKEKTSRPGAYSVLVRFPAPPAPAPAAAAQPATPPDQGTPAPPAVPVFKPESAQITLTRPGVTTVTGDVSVPSPLRVDRVYGFGTVEWQPSGWPIIEKTGKVAATFRPAAWSAHLTRTDGAPGQVLRLGLQPLPTGQQPAATTTTAAGSVEIPKGGTMELVPSDGAGWIRPGTATGTLLLISPQLAKPLELPVEVRSRLSRWYLFWMLVGSAILGWLVRNFVESKRILAEARLTATGPARELAQLAAATVDPGYEQRYTDALNRLRSAVGVKKPGTITDAVTEARAAIDKIGTDLAAGRKAATDTIARVRGRVGDPRRQTGELRQIAEEAQQGIRELSELLSRGFVSEPQRRAAEAETKLDEDLDTALPAWRTATKALLDELRSWPEVPSGDLAPLQKAVDELKVETALDSAADLNGELRARLDQVTLPAAGRLAADVVTGLRKLPKTETGARHIEAIEAAAATLAQVDAAAMTDPKLVRGPLSALRERLGEALDHAKTKAVPALAEGKFREAIGEIVEQYRSDVVLGSKTAAPEALPPLTDAARVNVPPPVATPIGVAIVTDGVPIVGEPLRLRAVLTGDPAVLRTTTLWWFAGDVALKVSAPGETTAVLRPSSTVPVEVKVVVKSNGPEPEARLLLTPHAREWHDAAALENEASKLLTAQTVVAAAITLAGGYVIFHDAWLGTPVQFFSVLLWGFSIDFSVSRVLELAKPLLEQKPIPKPAGG